MSESHRVAADPPRPPWFPIMVGVRCPSCGLGGDIPDTIVRTVCPRCDAVFDVAAARAERPTASTAPTAPTAPPAPAAVVPPVAALAIPAPPITPDEVVDPLGWPEPLAPDDPLYRAGLALIPARSRDRSTDGRPHRAAATRTATRPRSATPTRGVAARPRKGVRTAAVGASLFALGMVAGGTLFRNANDGVTVDTPAEYRDAADRDEVADAAPTTGQGAGTGTVERSGSSTAGPEGAPALQSPTPGSSTNSRSSAKPKSSATPWSSSKQSASKRSTSKRSGSTKAAAAGSGSGTSSEKSTAARASTGGSSDRSTSTTARPGSSTTRAAERQVAGTTPTTTAEAPSTTIGAAAPALPGVTIPAVRDCEGLDCRMTAPSGVDGIPVPDDAVEMPGASGPVGWTTHAASIEDLTAWYLRHLTELGWVLNGPVSVMDPTEGEARELGHTTSAVYCPTGPDDPIVAVNIGWPSNDTSGDTVVLAVVAGIDDSACD